MQFTASHTAMLKALQAVSRGVSGRSTQAIQSNILIEADENRLTLTATDLEYICIEDTLDALVREPGSVTVPAKFFQEITTAMSGSDITLSLDDNNKAVITSGKSKYQCVTLPAKDYSKMPPIENAVSFTVPAEALHDALTGVLFAVSRDQTRPILTGVLLTAIGDILRFVSTDTYRLAMKDLPNIFDGDTQLNAIISRTALAELVRLVNNRTDDVTVSISDSMAQFVVGSVTVSTRLIEGQFVAYTKVIPANNTVVVQCDVTDLSTALSRAMPVAREDANRVVFKSDESMLCLSTSAQDVGTYEDDIAADVNGVVETAFNAAYVMDMLNTVQGSVTMLFPEGQLGSAIIRPTGDESHTYVIMPMQIMT